MKLVVALDFRFVRTPDGRVWTRTTYPRAFWGRYLKVFDQVKIVARAEQAPRVDDNYQEVTGEAVQFAAVPFYLGPWQYLKARRQVREVIRAAVGVNDAVLCRVASQIASDLLPTLWAQKKPYGLEVGGDPYEAFAPGAVKHILRPIFRYHFTKALKLQCVRAAAVSYVTQNALQNRYPTAYGCLSTGVSDVELSSGFFRESPRAGASSDSSNELSFDGCKLARRSRSRSKKFRLLFVGSLGQMYKGQDVLIHAVALLVKRGIPIELRIAGDGRHREDLEALVNSMHLSEIISFLGEVPAGEAIRNELDQACIFVLPSRTEGLPRVIIEAMARGVPCIATKVGGVPELLEPEYLVRPNDPLALADKLHEVLSDRMRLEQMSSRNLRKAQQFRPELLEKKRTEFYRELREQTQEWVASTAFQAGRLVPSQV